jgi:hypothetical protein
VHFLTPWSAVIAAAVAIPLMLLLYFLKLRRQPLRMASTLLWPRAQEELEVNAPFRRLRLSLLLLLQLLLLAAVLLALGQPVLQVGGLPASRVILLIDQSASMSAADADGRTRLEAAKEAAREIVQRLGRGDSPRRIMVVAFGASARVAVGFESRRRLLLEAIDSVEPTDEEADLEAALQLAGAFATQREANDESTGSAESPEPPEVILISDGGVGDPPDSAGFGLRAGTFRFVAVGPVSGRPVGNVGITSFTARREYHDPQRVLVFARLTNASSREVEVVATLRVDDEPAAIEQLRIPGAGDDLGEVTVTFGLELDRAAILSLHQNQGDDLAADDTAALVVRGPERPRIGLVHAGQRPDPFLHDLLEALEPQWLRPLSLDAYSAYDPRGIDSGVFFDLIVFDRAAPPRLPGLPTLTVGAVPVGISTAPATAPGGKRILSWQRQHPLMRHVALDTIVFADFGGLRLPAGATALAEGPDGPVIAEVATRGARHVLVGFSLTESNWPLHVSSAIFMQNVVTRLTLAGSSQGAVSTRPGEPITVRSLPDVDRLSIAGPIEATVEVDPGSETALPALRRAGIYVVRGAVPPSDRIAVNVLSDIESDLRPKPQVRVNASAAAGGTVGSVAPLELWPWLVGFGFGLLVLEWLVYCRRMRG